MHNDKAKSIGNTIFARIFGQTNAENTFKKQDKATILNTQSSVKIGGEAVQRLTVAAKASRNLASVFKCKLCSHPPALFDASLRFQWPHKTVLSDAIWSILTYDFPEITTQGECVLDGAALVQHKPCALGYTINYMWRLYTDYATRKYGEAIVVCDGYEGTSAKDLTNKFEQVQQWKETVDNVLPHDWGWKESNEILSELTYHQLLMNSYRSSDAAARQSVMHMQDT
ncbi:hypothetical protein MAR_032867 [Mya arenaria]|uniref:Uncharacterized protein n=1 Tax=Mya arenaria TaxID=6604 RepID=A0ABY7G7B5_MYAAR|nr:hypothetical protein MAR_032867 [Mya arenaria]